MQREIDAVFECERRFGVGATPGLGEIDANTTVLDALSRISAHTPLIAWLPKTSAWQPTTGLVWVHTTLPKNTLFASAEADKYRKSCALEQAWLQLEELMLFGDKGLVNQIRKGGGMVAGREFTDVFISPGHLAQLPRRQWAKGKISTTDGLGRQNNVLQKAFNLSESGQSSAHLSAMLAFGEDGKAVETTLFLNQFMRQGFRQNIEMQVYYPMSAVLKEGRVVGWICAAAVVVNNPSLCAVLVLEN